MPGELDAVRGPAALPELEALPELGALPELEALRERYRPRAGSIRLLLLGSSPPPGHGFFYRARSTVFECTRRVLVDGFGFPRGADAFLQAFADAGFFLDDFSGIRGDRPAERALDADVRAGVERIAATIGRQQPLVVVGVLQRIERLVGEAVERSGRPDTPWICLPFPNWRSDGTRKAYEAGLRGVIADCGLLDGSLDTGRRRAPRSARHRPGSSGRSAPGSGRSAPRSARRGQSAQE